MNDFLIPIAFFAAVVAIIFLFIRKKERMALLERGLDPRSFENQNTNLTSLKYGLLLTGVGLGILLANIIVSAGLMSEEPAYFSFVALFGGVALIIDYILERSIITKQKSEKKVREMVND